MTEAPVSFYGLFRTWAQRIGIKSLDGAAAWLLQTLVIYYCSLALVVAYVWRLGFFPFDFFSYWHSLFGALLNATFIAWLTVMSLALFYPAYWFTVKYLSPAAPPAKKWIKGWAFFGVPFWLAVIIYRILNAHSFGEFPADFYLVLALLWAAFLGVYVYGNSRAKRDASLAAIVLFLPLYVSDSRSATYAVEQLFRNVGLGGGIEVEVIHQDQQNALPKTTGQLMLLGPDNIYLRAGDKNIVIPRLNTRTITLSHDNI